MPMFTSQRELFERAATPKSTQDSVTIGTVVDTNDPQQMGRVRIVCPQWGDSWTSNVEDLPWALYVSPFGGQMQTGTRGPGVQESEGGVAYGMWAIPKVGAQVVVMCVDGNPMTRMYFGCIYDQFTPHTMPHGRFMYDDHPELEKSGSSPAPYGPYTSTEKYIQPLTANMKLAFGAKDEPNHEYRTRAADYSVARVDVSQLGQTYSRVQDDEDVDHDGWTSTQGYQASRSDPNAPSSYTNKNYDSMVYSFVSPGFHALSMDDRQENCRVRLRTTSGHQIIMDDTNERIYIATAKGNNWIEMDQDGNIDIFTSNKLSVHATKDINFTSDETIRMHAKKGIHMHSDDEVRIDAAKDIHVRTDKEVRVDATNDIHLQTDANLRIGVTQAAYIEAGQSIHAKCSSTLHIDTGSTLNLLAGGNMLCTAPEIHLNGPSAASASPAGDQPATKAFWTNKVPTHEPYARVMTKDDFTHEPEVPYDDANVGKIERGNTITRGMFWRR